MHITVYSASYIAQDIQNDHVDDEEDDNEKNSFLYALNADLLVVIAPAAVFYTHASSSQNPYN